MNRSNGGDGFDFEDDGVVHKQVNTVTFFINRFPAKNNRKRTLHLNRMPSLFQCDFQTPLINLFEQPRP